MTTHRRVFGRIVEFGHDFDGFVISRADIDSPVPGADPTVAQQMERYVERIGGGVDSGTAEQVRERIIALMPSGGRLADRVARHLGVDRRTVHRRLAAEGWTFSDLLQDVRSEYAAHYISSSRRPLTDIAGLLGFSAQSAFTRWFRSSFGVAPSDWRKLHKTRRDLVTTRG
jgi:AraC-like DNA-binding protein